MSPKKYFIGVLIMMVLLVAGFNFINDPEEERYYCSADSRLVDACLQIYNPVCGWFDPGQVQCFAEPCAETFPNDCTACRNRTVLYIINGECPGINEAVGAGTSG